MQAANRPDCTEVGQQPDRPLVTRLEPAASLQPSRHQIERSGTIRPKKSRSLGERQVVDETGDVTVRQRAVPCETGQAERVGGSVDKFAPSLQRVRPTGPIDEIARVTRLYTSQRCPSRDDRGDGVVTHGTGDARK